MSAPLIVVPLAVATVSLGAAVVHLRREVAQLGGRLIEERSEAQRRLRSQAEELAALEAELEGFARAISHDLREPLRMVSQYMERLGRLYSERLDEEGNRYVHFASDGAQRMRAIIDGLVAYARLLRQQPNCRVTPLSLVVEQARAQCSELAIQSQASFDVGELPRLWVDGSLLANALECLFRNSMVFASDVPPRVCVTAEPGANAWTVSVKDNGIGFDPKFANQIFRPLKRLHAVGSYPGSGMGLAIACRIVALHGGRMWANSSPGVGAEVCFSIPDRAGNG